MALKTMDPAKVRELLEGARDIITPAVQMEAEIYRHARCPRCQQTGHCIKVPETAKVELGAQGPVVTRSSFSPDKVLQNGYARCTNCDTEFYPESGIIRRTEPFLTAVQSEDPFPG